MRYKLVYTILDSGLDLSTRLEYKIGPFLWVATFFPRIIDNLQQTLGILIFIFYRIFVDFKHKFISRAGLSTSYPH